MVNFSNGVTNGADQEHNHNTISERSSERLNNEIENSHKLIGNEYSTFIELRSLEHYIISKTSAQKFGETSETVRRDNWTHFTYESNQDSNQVI